MNEDLKVILAKLTDICRANAHVAERVAMLGLEEMTQAQKDERLPILKEVLEIGEGCDKTMALILALRSE